MKKLKVVLMSCALAFSLILVDLAVGDTTEDVVLASEGIATESNITTSVEGNKVTVNVYSNGDLERFAYGVKYDSNEVDVVSYEFNKDFLKDQKSSVYIIEDVPDKQYVAMGGCFSNEYTYNGVVATVTFKVKDGVSEVKGLGLINDFESLKVEDAKFVLGDINGDGDVSLLDARLSLRMALDIQETTADALKRGDVNHDGDLSLVDSRLTLRAALGISELK